MRRIIAALCGLALSVVLSVQIGTADLTKLVMDYLPNGVFLKSYTTTGAETNLIGKSGNDTNVNWDASNNLNFTRGGSTQWRIDSSSNILGNNGANTIAALTSDGSDSNSTYVGGGGSPNDTRGGYIRMFGNENASTGILELGAGNVTGGVINFKTNGSNSMVIDKSQNTSIVGTITSSRTTDLGWTPQTATAQACNTVCTSACVTGIASGLFVSCATTVTGAGACLCAGAS